MSESKAKKTLNKLTRAESHWLYNWMSDNRERLESVPCTAIRKEAAVALNLPHLSVASVELGKIDLIWARLKNTPAKKTSDISDRLARVEALVEKICNDLEIVRNDPPQ